MNDLTRYGHILWQRKWLIALCVIVSSVSGFVFTVTQPPRFQSTISLLVNPAAPNPSIAFLDQSVQGADSVGQLVASYTEYLKSRNFTERAIDQLGLAEGPETLARAITTFRVPSTNVYKITIVWSTPEDAQRIANGMADLFIAERKQSATVESGLEEQQKALEYYQSEVTRLRAQRAAVESSVALAPEARREELLRIQSLLLPLEDIYVKWSQAASANRLAQQARTDTASVLDRATLPTGLTRSEIQRNVLFAALAGLVLGFGLALLLEYLDDTVKSPDDVLRIASLPTLGNIVRLEAVEGETGHLINQSSLSSPEAEAYRILRTNVQFATVNKPVRAIVVTSSRPQEGKTTTLANLGIAMARSGARVIVIDTDLRRPSLHRRFGLPNTAGFTNLLIDEHSSVEDLLQTTDVSGLRVLTSGPVPPNPAELLGSPRFRTIIEDLKDYADILLVDSPPISAVVDPVILADRVGYVLLVVEAGQTRSNDLAAAQAALAPSGATILGVVMNKITPSVSGYYYYYYSQYYSSYTPSLAKTAVNGNGNGTANGAISSYSLQPPQHRKSRPRTLVDRALALVGRRPR